MNFSQRMKITSKPKFQREFIGNDLKVSLWNHLYLFYKEYLKSYNSWYWYFEDSIKALFEIYWDEIFKKPVSQMPVDAREQLKDLQCYFLEQWQWYEIYDFWEFTVKKLNTIRWVDKTAELKAAFNRISEKENSAYRFVGNNITPIIAGDEIKEVENACDSKAIGAANHIAA